MWRTLANFDDVSTWSHAVTKADFSSAKERGVGAERVCEVSGLGTLIEQVVHWTEGETLALAPKLGAALGEAVVQFKRYVETGKPLPGNAEGQAYQLSSPAAKKAFLQ